MNPQDQRTIEQLLEQLGANESLGDPSHRYALRRSILNSRYFEVHRARVVWERMIAIGGPAVAGGFVVCMVVLAVHVAPVPGETGVAETEAVVQSGDLDEEITDVVLADDISELVADESSVERSVLPRVTVVDLREQVPMAQFVNFMNENFTPTMAQ